MPKPAVPPKYVNGKDMSDNSENEVTLIIPWFALVNLNDS